MAEPTTGDGDLGGYRHPGGMTLPLPEAWERAEDPAPGLVLVAIEPEHAPDDDPGFRANLVVTLDKLDDGLGLDDWQAGTERLFPTSLGDYLVLDLERLDLSGVRGIRRLAHHRTEQNSAVTMEQWTTVLPHPDGGVAGWSLTASVATAQYPSLADLFAYVAGGWRPPGHPAATEGQAP